jgi:uncharacterized membrane protein
MSVLTERVRGVEDRVADLGAEVAALRRELEAAEVGRPEPVEAPPPWIRPPARVRRPRTAPREPVRPLARTASPFVGLPRRSNEPGRPLMDLIGPRALAWAGGVAMLLGIVFLFVLAVRRGWVDAELRVTLGAMLSVGLVGVGARLHRRHERLPAALVAVGTGVAGLYVTLAAATAIYGFVPERLGLALADLVGAAAVFLAIRWRTQTIAALGLVGAVITVPVVAGGISVVGTAFVAAALAAAAAVAERQRWHATLAVGLAAALPQVVALAVAGGERWPAALLIGGFALACLRSAVSWQLRHGGRPMSVPAAALLGSSAIAAVTLAVARFAVGGVGPDPQGMALGAAALAYLAAAAYLRRQGARDPMSIVGGLGLALAAASIAELAGGVERVAALAAAALLVAWLARPLRERRLLAAGAGGVVVTVGFALATAPPTRLLSVEAVPGLATLALGIAAAAIAGLAWLARADRLGRRTGWAALAAALIAAWGGIMAVAMHLAGPDGAATAFQRGQAAATLTWALVGLALLWLGVRRPRAALRRTGTALLLLGLAKLAAFDLAALEAMPRALAFLAVGAAVLTAGVLVSRLAPARGEEPEEIADAA